MLRYWLGMPVVNVSLHETPVCAAKGCKTTFGGDMLSGSHWDSQCFQDRLPPLDSKNAGNSI
jgi:hypothetical protein